MPKNSYALDDLLLPMHRPRAKGPPLKIKKSSKVRVHYIKDGNDMIADKVIYTDKD
jgi:hypothetical protein